MFEKPLGCSHCAKRFADERSRRMHHKAVHATAVKCSARSADNDESFATRSIKARLDHAMGIHNEDYDWLVDP